MVMRQELQINRYFDHAMSSGEEQNFLISLAASDDMRIAFRSHLELMKAVREDKDGLRSVAQVRNRTLTALGLSAAAVTPFIEQELVRNAKPLEASSTSNHPLTASIGGASKGGLFSTLLRTPKYALSTGIMLGFLGAVTVMNLAPSSGNAPHGITPAATTSQPVVTPDVQKPTNSAASETIPASNGLNSVQASSRSHGASDRAASAAKPASPSPTTLENQGHVMTATPATSIVPEVNVGGKGAMQTHKATIHNTTTDSTKAR